MKIQVASIPKIGVVDSRPHNRQNVSIEEKIKEVCDFVNSNRSFLRFLIV